MGAARSDLSWVNILRDPDAAQYVAGFHDGDEVVPTVVTGTGELIPGTTDAVKAQLAGRSH